MLYSFLTTRDAWQALAAVSMPGRPGQPGQQSVVTTYAQLARRVRELARPDGALAGLAGRSVGLAMGFSPDWLACAAALDGLGCRTFLVASTLPPREVAGLADAFALDAVITDRHAATSSAGCPDRRVIALPHQDAESGSSQLRRGKPKPALLEPLKPISLEPQGSTVVLFTSGTSGRPKAAAHTWASLAGGIKRNEKWLGAHLLLAYDATRYAGIQVLLTAVLNGARLAVPADRTVPAAIDAILADRVEFASATPTFWRMLLAQSSPDQRRRMCLRQITLGGEAVSQPLLDNLRGAFPEARITHIYASTEMGVCFSVHDGLEGFPADLLDNEATPVRLTIRDGRLWVGGKSQRAMTGYLPPPSGPDESGQSASPADRGRWFDTGDAVELCGGRVYFRGRESDRINVGGEKVYPQEVEAVIRQAAGVADVRVSGLASSIAGQLVQAEVVLAPDADQADVRRRISELARQLLAEFKQPRVIRFVDRLAELDTLKISRRAVIEAEGGQR